MWEEVPVKELMAKIVKICSDHKSEAEGGEGIGPARQEKSITAARKAGKPRDTLVDDIIIEVQEPVKQSDKSVKEMRTVVYCVGCQKKTVGRDPNCIKQHAKDCSVRCS